MPDLSAELLPRLRSHRLPGLDLGPGWDANSDLIYPNYGGGSILNLPSSICRWLGAPPFGKEILWSPLADAFGSDIQRVILILVDGLSLGRMHRWLESQPASPWHEITRRGLLAPLTSIVPSTTCTAMASLWSGRSPAEHAIVGYELWLKEYGVVANMILHTPMSFQNDPGGLSRAGFAPQAFLGFPTMGSHLAAHGVRTYAFLHNSITRSGLSQMLLQDVQVRSYSTTANLWINLREHLHQPAQERQYIWVYWSEVDHSSHHYGPDDERTQAEFQTFSQALQDLLLKPLKPWARQGTLLVLTADHGQIATPIDAFYELRRHPAITRRLHILPTGENRLAFLYPRPGQIEAVREAIERTWPRQFTFLDPSYAVQQGLFGPGQAHPRLLDRLGDLILVSRGSAYLWWSDQDNPLSGRHGGLSPDEMLVPFLAARLDA